MSNIALREKRTMKSDEFISSLLVTKESLSDESTTLRELKAIYFTINLDYIRLCENINNGRYFSSRNCDRKIRHCIDKADFNIALEIVNQRIIEITESLS